MMSDRPQKQENETDLLEIYKLLVEMADRVSQRRQSANSFFLSVNTAIIGGAAYLSKSVFGQLETVAVSVAGIAICALWIRSVISYKTLNAAKFQVITKFEGYLPVSPFKDEWEILDVDGDGKKHKPFHQTEVLVPWIFVFVHGALVMSEMPWKHLISMIMAQACNSG